MSSYYPYDFSSYATNPAGNISNRPVSRPYKVHPGTGGSGTQTPADRAKTTQARIDACKSRVTRHIGHVNANPNIPAERKTAMIQALNVKLIECATPHGLDKEEKDKDHKDVENLRQGQGKLVSQITPGKLRKNPNPIAALIDAIWDFFGGITNRPEPVDRFMAKYPNPNLPAPST